MRLLALPRFLPNPPSILRTNTSPSSQQVYKSSARTPATNITGHPSSDYYVNYKDAPTGFVINGTLPTGESQGVHSLTDVPVFARGPCQHLFAGVYNSIDVFFNIAGKYHGGRMRVRSGVGTGY